MNTQLSLGKALVVSEHIISMATKELIEVRLWRSWPRPSVPTGSRVKQSSTVNHRTQLVMIDVTKGKQTLYWVSTILACRIVASLGLQQVDSLVVSFHWRNPTTESTASMKHCDCKDERWIKQSCFQQSQGVPVLAAPWLLLQWIHARSDHSWLLPAHVWRTKMVNSGSPGGFFF